MPATVRLKNINPLGDIDMPLIGRVGDNFLKAGEEFDVSADIAGRVPGTWRAPTEAEQAEGCVGLDTRTNDDGAIEVLCPGVGLLSQVGNFELAQPPARTSKEG